MITQTEQASILGTWRLRAYLRVDQATGARTPQFGAAPQGLLSYSADQRMYVQFCQAGRVKPLGAVATSAEAAALYGSMCAYAGRWSSPHPGTIIHHVETSWNESWTGTDLERTYTLSGDVLNITTAAYRSYADDKQGTSLLIWDRLHASG
jgi:hypothetical protein